MPSWAKLFVVGGLLVVGLPCLLTVGAFRSWQQEGPSMAPNLPHGTGFFASRFGEAEPGDVVVFESPADDLLVVKRVIATGGQTVEIVEGRVLVDGEPVERQEIGPATPPRRGYVCYAEKIGDYAWVVLETEGSEAYDQPPITVPEDHLYVLGDNRSRSNDSRYFGPVSTDSVKGILAWVYRPGLEADTPECLPPEP